MDNNIYGLTPPENTVVELRMRESIRKYSPECLRVQREGTGACFRPDSVSRRPIAFSMGPVTQRACKSGLARVTGHNEFGARLPVVCLPTKEEFLEETIRRLMLLRDGTPYTSSLPKCNYCSATIPWSPLKIKFWPDSNMEEPTIRVFCGPDCAEVYVKSRPSLMHHCRRCGKPIIRSEDRAAFASWSRCRNCALSIALRTGCDGIDGQGIVPSGVELRRAGYVRILDNCEDVEGFIMEHHRRKQITWFVRRPDVGRSATHPLRMEAWVRQISRNLRKKRRL